MSNGRVRVSIVEYGHEGVSAVRCVAKDFRVGSICLCTTLHNCSLLHVWLRFELKTRMSSLEEVHDCRDAIHRVRILMLNVFAFGQSHTQQLMSFLPPSVSRSRSWLVT